MSSEGLNWDALKGKTPQGPSQWAMPIFPPSRAEFERLVERVDQLIEELDELRMQLEGDEA